MIILSLACIGRIQGETIYTFQGVPSVLNVNLIVVSISLPTSQV